MSSDSRSSSKYEQSGVSTGGAESALSGLLKHILPTRTFNPGHEPKNDTGYFANVVDLGRGEGLAFCTDGVGTKIVVAEMMGKYDTIGIDCVAMNVNDVICVGARPIAMVDYIACASADESVFTEIGRGLAEGARQAGVGIVGGEISQVGEIVKGLDLIGACVGLVSLGRINTGREVRPGNLIIGLESSGVHANGLTLARRALLGETLETQLENINRFSPQLGHTLGEELLKPTRIYVNPVLEMLTAGIAIKAMVNITGGGFGNLNRVEAGNIRFVIDDLPDIPLIFSLIQDAGEVTDPEMFQVFNMGIGFCVVVEDTKAAEAVQGICKKHEVPSHVIGAVDACQGKEVLLPEKNLKGVGQSFTYLPNS